MRTGSRGNSQQHKTVCNESNTVQWRDGILHPQENQREGKKDRKKDVEAVSDSRANVSVFFFFNMSRYFML